LRTPRILAASAAALLVATGMSVSTTAAVAGAAPAVDTSECRTSQTATFSWAGSLGTKYHLTKEVLEGGRAAPGATITFRTTVRGAGALITRIDDVHPAGFELVSARHSVWKVFGGQSWADVTDDVTRDAASNTVYLTGAGWTTSSGSRVTLETTYRVPSTATPGDVYNTGAAFTSVLANGRKTANPINTCVTVRDPNAAEAVTGSLDDLGLGSVTAGSTTAGTLSSDPTSFSADLINGIDVGQLIGGLVGS